MIATWYGRVVAVIDDPLSEPEIARYRAAGRIVRCRFKTVRRWLP